MWGWRDWEWASRDQQESPMGMKGNEVQSRGLSRLYPRSPGKPGGVSRERLAIGLLGEGTPKGLEMILEHSFILGIIRH